MGVHIYPCPTCSSPQKVRAESGEIVTIQDCDACAQTKRATRARQADNNEAGLEAEELDRYARRQR